MPLLPQIAPGRASRKRLVLALLACGTALAGSMPARAQSPGDAAPSDTDFTQTVITAPEDQTGRFGATGSDLEGRENRAEAPIAGRTNRDDGEAQGLRLGSFTLRPSIEQGIKSEKKTDGNTSQKRTYLDTTIRGTLTSDWSRHALTVDGQGTWQKNLSGDISTDPGAQINADLRLDLGKDTTGHITGGYQIGRQDNTDPNAISGANVQSDVQTLSGGASLSRDLGRIRGLVGLDVARTTYSSVTLTNGSRLDLSDRDRNAYTLRGRIGYEISPALVPFIQASLGKTAYDQETDTNGYRRSSDNYALRTGLEVNLGEKLNGEFGVGYQNVSYDDARLKTINALTLDGTANWSPQRGTNVTLGLQTSVEDSTSPGESGAVLYRLSSGVSHELRDDLTGRITGSTTWRNYPSGSQTTNYTVYNIGTELAYKINRYLELNGSVDYEWTKRSGGNDSDDLVAGVGLLLKR